jgi:hypothetical protein
MNGHDHDVSYAIREVSVEIKAVLEWLKSHANLATKHDLKELELKIMASQAELAAQLKANTEQAAKIGAETQTLLDKIRDLLEQLANQSGVTPELQAAADALKAQLQVVDDLVPDAATPPPTP